MLDNRRIFVQMNYYNDYELRERKVINVLHQENTYQNAHEQNKKIVNQF